MFRQVKWNTQLNKGNRNHKHAKRVPVGALFKFKEDLSWHFSILQLLYFRPL